MSEGMFRPGSFEGLETTEAGDRVTEDRPGDDPSLAPPTAQDVHDGAWRSLPGRAGIGLQSLDLIPGGTAASEQRHRPALYLSLLLEGESSGSIADLSLDQAVGRDRRPVGQIWNSTRPSTVRRRLQAGRRLRQVVVALSPAALDTLLPAERQNSGKIARFLKTDLAKTGWQPTEHTVHLGERLLASPADIQFPDCLHLEGFVLGIIAEALTQLAGQEEPLFAARGSSRDVRRAKRARDFIDAHIDEAITLERVALESGMSISTLQRAFRGTTDMTAVEYLRRRRLERAHDLLRRGETSIADAASMAGYSSTANFSTAFKRRFGAPPSHCLA